MPPSTEFLNESEFSQAMAKLEKKILQFGVGNWYLTSVRNLNEFTLALKKLKIDEEQSNPDFNNDEQFDNTTNLNLIADIIRESNERMGNKFLTKREIQAIEMLQMNYNILQSEFQSLRQ